MTLYTLPTGVQNTIIALVDAMLAASDLPDQEKLRVVSGTDLDFLVGETLLDRSNGRFTLHSIDGRLIHPITAGVMVVAPVGWHIDKADPDACRNAIVGRFAYRRMGLQFVRCALVEPPAWRNFVAHSGGSQARTQLSKDGAKAAKQRVEAIFAQLLEAAEAPGVDPNARSLALHFLRLNPTIERCWTIATILGGQIDITVSFGE